MKKDKTNIYSISDLAQRFDITTRTIRFYESEGLLAPKREGQKRLYSQKDYTTLKLILRGKRLGWSLAESRDLIQMYTPEHNNQAQYQKVLEKVADSRERLQQQMNDIQVMLLELDEHEARIKEVLKASSTSSEQLA
ncbi:MAG: DNA-binding transcriptional MerR regulator [Oceanicoccus sp.]|jgi:DNA-binding transcriptional MerR regulator